MWSDDGRSQGRALSVRAVMLGLVVAVLVNIWIACSEHLLGSSRMNLSHFPLALFVTFLVLVIPLNMMLKRISLRLAFSPSELLVVLTMGLAAAVVPASGLTGFFLGVIATPFYFASPENRWGEFFHPYIPSWLAPADEGGASFSPPQSSGSTFSFPGATARNWVLVRPDGVPVGIAPTATTCGTIGSIGTGGAGLYFTSNSRDYAVTLSPLGAVRVHAWNGAGWTL